MNVRIFPPNLNLKLSFPSSKDFKFLEKIPFFTSLYQALNESERKRRVGKLIKSN